MRTWRFSAKSADSRILCVSYRDIGLVISRCGQYEFEDLIATVDAVDVIAPAGLKAPEGADGPFQAGVLTLERLAVKAWRRLKVKFPLLAGRRVPPDLGSDYEMLIVNCEAPGDLYDFADCVSWRSRARVSVCVVQELYASDVPNLGDLLKLLQTFDHIIVAVNGTAEALSEAIGRPCHYVPFSTDTLLFCPYPNDPTRVIDFYALGHRPARTHEALLQMAKARDWYYMYDTVANSPVSSHVEHRRRLAEMIKRSQFFLVNFASWHKGTRTGDQQVFGCRYFEGAAAGAVLVGGIPSNDAFAKEFGWKDSVIPLPFDSSDVADVLCELENDQGRLEEISRRNTVNSLRRHDHVYRWGEILAIAGMPETKAMEDRRNQLAELAASIERTTSIIRHSGLEDFNAQAMRG